MIQFITLISNIVITYGLLFKRLLYSGICVLLFNKLQSTKLIKYERKQTSKTNLTHNQAYYGSIHSVLSTQQ